MTEALSSLAETFKNVGVSKAYGPAVTVDGEELIPVALVSFGFGGGGNSGSGPAGAAAGGPGEGPAAGGGGGGFVLPLGCTAAEVTGRWRSGPTASPSSPGWFHWCVPSDSRSAGCSAPSAAADSTAAPARSRARPCTW